jgi:hypothetical protein
VEEAGCQLELHRGRNAVRRTERLKGEREIERFVNSSVDRPVLSVALAFERLEVQAYRLPSVYAGLG